MTDQERLQWFREAKFGIFLHWSLYTLVGANEWTFNTDCWTFEEYVKLADEFKAENYNPREWAALAVEIGAKYMVLTSRHHEGFCLFDTQTTDFCAPKTGAGRDLLAEYIEAVREAGLKVGLYYSLVDWRFKGAWDREKYPESAQAMVEQAHTQVRELLTNYGRIDLLWYDGSGRFDSREQAAEFWRSEELNQMAWKLQPHLVINNRNGLPGDFDTPEQRIQASQAGRAWEACMTIDPLSWSCVPYSPARKTAAQVVHMMLETAAGGGNLLLNTGPQADGSLHPVDVAILREAGAWRRRYAEALEGARLTEFYTTGIWGPGGHLARWIGSPDPTVYYVGTRGWPRKQFRFPRVDGEVLKVELLPDHEELSFRWGPWKTLIVDIPEAPPDDLSTMFKITFADEPRVLPIPSREEVMGCPL